MDSFIILVLAGQIVFIIATWFGTTWLIGRWTKWFALQRRFPESGERAFLSLTRQTGWMGRTRIRGAMRFEACRGGLRVGMWRFFGPFSHPFLVPWDQIDAQPEPLRFAEAICLTFGRPEVGRLTMAEPIWRALVNTGNPPR